MDFICKYCKKKFIKSQRYVQSVQATAKLEKFIPLQFCSKKCNYLNSTTKQLVSCNQCNKKFSKTKSQIKKTKHNFCSHSCHAKYINQNKIKGTRRSKLEKWIENTLIIHYPLLEFHFNKKDAINSELDIYIPSLKLAFELNGIFHYEPIFGESKLNQIQNNDQRKFQACLERGIELCIIDVSQQKYFKENSSQKYLKIIQDIISNKMHAGRDSNSH